MTSYAQVIKISDTEWKVSGSGWSEILVPTFSDRRVVEQIATAINQAYRQGRNDVRSELRSLIGSPLDPEDCQ